MKSIKGKLNNLFKKFGYSVKSILPPIDVRFTNNDPRQILYYSPRTILINAPTKWGRIRFFQLSAEFNPFVYAVCSSLNSKEKFSTIKSILKKYYKCVQPDNIYEWYGLNNEDAPKLSGVPIWAIPEPWKPVTIEKKTRSMQSVALNENKKNGKTLSIFHGDKCFGPVSEEKLCLEAERLKIVMSSIHRKGFQRYDGPDGDIEAQIFMLEDGQWRWMVTRGLHRAAVLAALDWQCIPVRVLSIIYRRDADIWPNVLSGLYTAAGA